MNDVAAVRAEVEGEFVSREGERWYVIRNVDAIAPFFISVISNVDHWLFISSTGGLTAGRNSPETALFPYITVDKIHESIGHTGSKTMLRIEHGGKLYEWEPFNQEQDGLFTVERNLYKNRLGNKVLFEEFNHDLSLVFRYSWATSEKFGFVRESTLENLGDKEVRVTLLDGLQNILPAGAPRFAQTNTSNLVDAYKWSELDETADLALFTLFSGITDRAEPCESLKANTAFCLGLENHSILISSEQVRRFRLGDEPAQETRRRGVRGAYFVSTSLNLGAGSRKRWQIISDVEKTQSEVVELQKLLAHPADVAKSVGKSIEAGSDELARLMARADGFQATAEVNVSVHHYANVLFNVLRGGIFDDQYNISGSDFRNTVRGFNRQVFERNKALLSQLPQTLSVAELMAKIDEGADPQLARLGHEYLPITFGRRHGDPSRPWNQFAIKLKDRHGNRLLSYEGNWRDIFQNWEALAFSYPDFVESMIAKFVNASTIDGYNPYRITKEGIDWEVEEPDDPWSYIGYWGDHQIIYLLKLLEMSENFHPDRLSRLLHEPVFSYANVPYKIRPLDALLKNPKETVDYDEALAAKIEERVERMGADGKLVMDASGGVYQVNLLEKLLVPLLSKLGNLVVDGGIWMNTQRPEWNDANNALVGQGLSMVTLYYLRRYVAFMQKLMTEEAGETILSKEVCTWLEETAAALRRLRPLLADGSAITAENRFAVLTELGDSACRYRCEVYSQETFTGKVSVQAEDIVSLLDDALAAIDHSIATNKRADGLYHAYNLLELKPGAASFKTLYPMLEGQVAVLSAGAISPAEAANVVEALFNSDVYRPDQKSFMLYPDRELPAFLEKNRVPEKAVLSSPLLGKMIQSGDKRIVVVDADGCYRFNAEFTNAIALKAALDAIKDDYGALADQCRDDLLFLYESVFDHQAFTGRSGGMFGFEGLGCIYWHMVAKLLLAVQENFFAALDQRAEKSVSDRLASLYYRVRKGIGFNKTPAEYGAFPTDPYSHTPKHAGARQPGMTGQVKEEILTRFGELGVRVNNGSVSFQPALLRRREFTREPRKFRFLDVRDSWQELDLQVASLAFTWCQVPVIYQIAEDNEPAIQISWQSGETQRLAKLLLPENVSVELAGRTGSIRQILVQFGPQFLLDGVK